MARHRVVCRAVNFCTKLLAHQRRNPAGRLPVDAEQQVPRLDAGALAGRVRGHPLRPKRTLRLNPPDSVGRLLKDLFLPIIEDGEEDDGCGHTCQGNGDYPDWKRPLHTLVRHPEMTLTALRSKSMAIKDQPAYCLAAGSGKIDSGRTDPELLLGCREPSRDFGRRLLETIQPLVTVCEASLLPSRTGQ